MDFRHSPEDELFRAQVRAFVRAQLPADIAARTFANPHPSPLDDFRRWQRILFERGWAAPHLPAQYGGCDWSALRKHIFMEELFRADAVDMGWPGLFMFAPVLVAFGSEWHREQFLQPTLSGDIYWCQGFSEPEAGSDLASLRTRAEADGDHYIVNGQKIWTSEAQYADWGFFLVRTNASVKPQHGISFLLIKMDTPGVTVRPIRSIAGGAELNEVFLDNVRVPKQNLLGEVDKGWTYAKYLLAKERTMSAFLYFNQRELEKVKEIARRELHNGRPLLDDPQFRHKLARVEVDVLALEWSVLRVLADEQRPYSEMAVTSALKLRGSSLQQRITELQVEALGPRALRFHRHHDFSALAAAPEDFWDRYALNRVNQYVLMRAATIHGGAQEIQRSIVAQAAFGLGGAG